MTPRSVSRIRRRHSRTHRRIPLLVFAAFWSASSAFAGKKGTDAIEARMKEIFDFNRNGVVKVQSSDPHGFIEGTGFYADSSGAVYTGLDVIGDGKDITVVQGMRKLPARVAAADSRVRIALLKVDAATPFLPIGDSSEVETYTPLMAIGHPFGKPAAWSCGLATGKQYFGRYFRAAHLMAELPVQPGFGGAPVLNLKGEVVGIVVAGFDKNTGCYILPINTAEKIRSDYNRFARLKPGWVGITVEAAENRSPLSNARIASLQPGPAAQAGLKEGDILLRVGDTPIRSPEDIFDASFFLTAGDETTITVLRDDRKQEFTFRVAEAPEVPSGSAPADRALLPEHSVLNLGNPAGSDRQSR